jgi:small GTP-binding protein
MFERFRSSTLEELGTILRLLDWNQIKEEVEQENRARVVFIGAGNAGKSTLLNRLKGWTVSSDAMKLGTTTTSHVENLGFFTLIDTPSDSNGNNDPEMDPNWGMLLTADLVLFIFDGAVGLRRSDYEWFARIRAAGKPMLAVLNKCDQIPHLHQTVAELNRQLGTGVIPISARYGTDVRTLLLPRILQVQPALTTALGREVIAFRREAAERVARRTALLCALFGTEPLPLLDIPFQAFVQTQMILRVALIYDQPTGDRYSRELIAMFALSALLRFAAQQVAKLVPLGGWLISAALAGGGTWSLGQAAIVYFEQRTHSEEILRAPEPRRRWTIHTWSTRLGGSLKERIRWIGKTFSKGVDRIHHRQL